MLGGKGCGTECALESVHIANEVIGGQDGHDGAWVPAADPGGAQGDGGGGVAFVWLCDDVFVGQGVADLSNGFFLEVVGKDEDVFVGYQSLEAADGVTEEGGVGEQLKELLGFGIAAERPEPFAAAAGQHEGIELVLHGQNGGYVMVELSLSSKASAVARQTGGFGWIVGM